MSTLNRANTLCIVSIMMTHVATSASICISFWLKIKLKPEQLHCVTGRISVYLCYLKVTIFNISRRTVDEITCSCTKTYTCSNQVYQRNTTGVHVRAKIWSHMYNQMRSTKLHVYSWQFGKIIILKANKYGRMNDRGFRILTDSTQLIIQFTMLSADVVRKCSNHTMFMLFLWCACHN